MKEISSVRLLLEDAYAAIVLSLHQWRVLWEDVSLVQARCALISRRHGAFLRQAKSGTTLFHSHCVTRVAVN